MPILNRLNANVTANNFFELEGAISSHLLIQEEIKKLSEGWDGFRTWIETGKIARILNESGDEIKEGGYEKLSNKYNQLINYWNEFIDSPTIRKDKPTWLEFIEARY